jgi:hypothetical protein
MEEESMKALITGGTGLPGRELLAKIADAVVPSREPMQRSDDVGPFFS